MYTKTTIMPTLCTLLAFCLFAPQAQGQKRPTVTHIGIDEKGTKIEDFEIVRSITVKEVYLPLLPMVFFDLESDNIPVRYRTDEDEARHFFESQFTQGD